MIRETLKKVMLGLGWSKENKPTVERKKMEVSKSEDTIDQEMLDNVLENLERSRSAKEVRFGDDVIYQGRWGYYAVPYEEYLKLKLVHKELWDAYRRFQRGEIWNGVQLIDPLFVRCHGKNGMVMPDDYMKATMRQYYSFDAKPCKNAKAMGTDAAGRWWECRAQGNFVEGRGWVYFHPQASQLVEAYRLASTAFRALCQVVKPSLDEKVWQDLCQRLRPEGRGLSKSS